MLFSRLAMEDSHEIVVAATEAIDEQARAFPRPWSVAELRLGESDLDWLRDFFGAISERTIRRCCSLVPNQVGGKSLEGRFGCLLLLYEAEVARRFATEGELWCHVLNNGSWSADAKRLLFVQGQPHARQKSALESGAIEFGLRQAFGEDGAQEYYQTVNLQFGFTRTGFERRLPEWLVRQGQPVAVERLLYSERHSSDNFARFWYALRAYRKGDVNADELRRIVEHSAWVLPEWYDSLIVKCRERIDELGIEEIDETDQSDAFVAHRRNRNFRSQSFLTAPRLKWIDGNNAQFVCQVSLSDDLELGHDTYDVVIDDIRCQRILRQSDGQYAVPSQEILLPAASDLVNANLALPDGLVVASQQLMLWDRTEDVEAYEMPSGRRTDPWGDGLKREHDYVLSLADDLVLEAAAGISAEACLGGRRLLFVPAEQLSSIVVLLDGIEFWKAWLHTREPEWLRRVTVEVKPSPTGTLPQAKLRFRCPDDIDVISVRFAGRLLDVTNRGGGLKETEAIPLDEHAWDSDSLTGVAVLRYQQQFKIKRFRQRMEPFGNLIRHGQRWRIVNSGGSLDAATAVTSRYRFAPTNQTADWHVFEGTRWLSRVNAHAQSLHGLEGRGAPLLLWQGPYNSTEPETRVYREVMNGGVIEDAKFPDTDSCVLTLHYAIEPDERHSVVCLEENGRLRTMPSQSVVCSDDSKTWTVNLSELPPGHLEPIAVALAFSGHRLGCWWASDWTRCLADDHFTVGDMVAELVEETSFAIRWLHLPILGRNSRLAICDFARSYAVPVLKTWLPDEVDRSGLSVANGGEGWWDVLRAVFFDWQPSASDALLLDRTIEVAVGNTVGLPTMVSTKTLSRISPILAARFVRAWVQSQSGVPITQARALLSEVQRQLLKGNSEEQLIQKVAEDVALSKTPGEGTLDFVRDGLLNVATRLFNEEDVPDVDRRNVEVAFRLDPFRTLTLVGCLKIISASAVLTPVLMPVGVR